MGREALAGTFTSRHQVEGATEEASRGTPRRMCCHHQALILMQQIGNGNHQTQITGTHC